MILDNDVIRYKDSGRRIRVLWQQKIPEYVYFIDIDENQALPNFKSLQEITELLDSGAAEIISDPLFASRPESSLSDGAKKKRDKAWDLIKNLVDKVPTIFFADKRHQLMKEQGLTSKGHHTVYRDLRRYWQRGQTVNALIPDYSNCGGKGKRRLQTDKKLGRPPKTVMVGIPITEELRKIFRTAIRRYYAKDKKFSIKAAYDAMLGEIFCEKTIDPVTGIITVKPAKGQTAETFPTLRQFKYWLDEDNNRLEIKRSRETARIYDKDMRGLIKTSTAEAWGPGSRYQIDATIIDVYVLSRFDRRRIIGRPVLYIIIDVYSRMIVGMYIGLEGPSWVTAMMALANCVEDKQAYCARYGVHIDKEDWPCQHLPAKLLGDRGEIAGRTIETLINNYRVTVENTAPYHADWKGIVEQRFKILPAHFKPYADGYIQSDYQARGGHDYRLDAVLDIDQMTAILIECVLYHNNSHELKSYDKDHDLAVANIPAVPIDLWEWGIANKSGQLRSYPAAEVKLSLLPRSTATVTELGIKFKGMFYTCQLAMQEKWFDKANQSGRWKIEVMYDQRDMDEIIIQDPNDHSKIQVCTKTERSRAYDGLSLSEIGQAQAVEESISDARKPKQQMDKLTLNARTEATVEQARAMKPKNNPTSKAEQVRDIRGNRAIENAAIRAEQAFRYGPTAENSGKPVPNNVVRFAPTDDDEFAEPTIADILNQAGEHNNE